MSSMLNMKLLRYVKIGISQKLGKELNTAIHEMDKRNKNLFLYSQNNSQEQVKNDML